LIGLRRRHAWLHTARTTPLRLANSQYVYRTSSGSDALVVALNVDDSPLHLSLSELGVGRGRIAAGSGVPNEDVIDSLDVEPHGWVIVEL